LTPLGIAGRLQCQTGSINSILIANFNPEYHRIRDAQNPGISESRD